MTSELFVAETWFLNNLRITVCLWCGCRCLKEEMSMYQNPQVSPVSSRRCLRQTTLVR